VERIPVEKPRKKFLPQGLWKAEEFSHRGCGKKVVAAVRKNGLFHISFLYGFFYYLTYLWIYISFIKTRKDESYALYL
jgi:hypothetical protein